MAAFSAQTVIINGRHIGFQDRLHKLSCKAGAAAHEQRLLADTVQHVRKRGLLQGIHAQIVILLDLDPGSCVFALVSLSFG